jgi:tetratricopeptide (TPR) repeat protein
MTIAFDDTAAGLPPRTSCMLFGIVLALCVPACIAAQVKSSPTHTSPLQQHYAAAQRFQSAHEMDKAAYEYRVFLTDALGEMAIRRAQAGQYEKAAADFDEALTFAPHSVVLQLEYAQAALQSGDLAHAKLLAERVNGESPQNAQAHLILGQVLLRKNMNQRARRELERAVALDSTFENGYELAVACLNTGDQEYAAKLFQEMTSSFGNTALIHMYFGQAYLNSDFQSKAVQEFQKAIAKDSKLPGVHYSLAAAYLAAAGDSRLSDAKRELRKEIASSPKGPMAYAALGHLEAGEQHYNEAEACLKHAAELDATNPDTFLYLGQLYVDMKRPADAKAALRSSIRLTTDLSRNHYQVQKANYLLGRLLMQSGDTEEGKKELQISQSLTLQNLARDHDRLADYLDESAGMSTSGPSHQAAGVPKHFDPKLVEQADSFETQIGPAVADSYNNLGAIAGSSRKYGAALGYFERAAEWNPALEGLDENWGRAAFAAGQFTQAVAPLRRYLQRHSDDRDMRSALGISLCATGDYASARTLLQPIAADATTSDQTKMAYAEALVKTGDIQTATTFLTALEQRDASSAGVHRALGEALALDNNTERAGQELETAIRMNPEDAQAYDALGRLQLAEGDATAAVISLEHAVKLEARRGNLHHDLAIAYRQASRPEDAAREMQQYEALSMARLP